MCFIVQMIFFCDIRNSWSLPDSEIRFLSNYKGERLSKWTKGIQWVDKYMVPLIIVEADYCFISPLLFAGSPSDHTGLFHGDCSAVSSASCFVCAYHTQKEATKETGWLLHWLQKEMGCYSLVFCAKRFIISQ